MRAKLGLGVLLLSVLFWTPGGPAAQLTGSRLEPLRTPLMQPASVTVAPEAPVVVPSAAAPNSGGWEGTAAITPSHDLTDDVLAAYTLAVGISPPECHLTTPVLAAIGQVESGNLAGHSLDASHRVVPEILGPVLDGTKYRAVPDTDAGHWDHNPIWDRALGPMQIIPASWRVVGLDMDGDGVRDPQNIYDAAGAAMVYLCAGGRDLSTADGLKRAILSYNDSDSYLRAVLAWKAVFDNADLTGIGAVPFVAALEVAPQPTPTPAATREPAAPTTTAAEPVNPTTPLGPGATPSSTSTSTSPATPARPVTPVTPAGTPAATPSSPAAPSTPSSPGTTVPGPDPQPSQTADPTPADPTPPSGDPTPPSGDPTPLPVCPVPTPTPTEPPADQAPDATAPTEPVVSPETCTPPEGYQFDPESGELVPIPTPAPAP